jgi:hypothetical protein
MVEKHIAHKAKPRRRMNHCPSTPMGQMNLRLSAVFGAEVEGEHLQQITAPSDERRVHDEYLPVLGTQAEHAEPEGE